MPEQLLTFELEKLSHGRQGAILDNCYFAPSTDGNAAVQACTFPKLLPIGEWSSRLEGCEAKSVAKCYHWQVIYGKKDGGFFLYAYDTRPDAFNSSASMDKTALFERAGHMGYDDKNSFCCKPFWTLKPVQGSNDSRCIAILINSYMWLVDIEFSLTEPAVIKGELHYIAQDLRKPLDFSALVAYSLIGGTRVSYWSSSALNLFDSLIRNAWEQLGDYAIQDGFVLNWDRAWSTHLAMLQEKLYGGPGGRTLAPFTDIRGYGPSMVTSIAWVSGQATANSHRNFVAKELYEENYKREVDKLIAMPTGGRVTSQDLQAVCDRLRYFIARPAGNDPTQIFWMGDGGTTRGKHELGNYGGVVTIQRANGKGGFYGRGWNHNKNPVEDYPIINLRFGNVFDENGDLNSDSVNPGNYSVFWLIWLIGDICDYLTQDLATQGALPQAAAQSLKDVAQTTGENANAYREELRKAEAELDSLIISAERKLSSSDRAALIIYVNAAKQAFAELDNELNLLTGFSLEIQEMNQSRIKVSDLPGYISRATGRLDAIAEHLERMADEAGSISKIISILMQYNVDYNPTFFDVLSSMLIVVATDNRFYYSDAGSANIEGDNFFAAQSGGGQSIPKECHRLGNRLCLLTNDTVEFWDSTLDYKQPLSPQYGHNVYSYEVIKDTVAVYDDAIYCIASSNLLPYRSVYRISKSGAMEKLSYPELDAYINARPLGSAKASLIELSKKPFVSFWLGDKAVNYDIEGNSFCLSDEILMYMGMPDGACFYLRWNAAEAGSLIDRANTVAKISTPPMAMGRSSKSLKLIQVEVDNHDVEKLVCEIDRQGSHDFNTTRSVSFKPGNCRNMLAKYENWGLINNNRMTLSWKGDLKINRAQWVME